MVVAERLRGDKREKILQYNTSFDQKEKDTGFIKTQLETHLKERFNVLVSTVEYEIVNGHLSRVGTTEPFIEVVKRGRDYIQSVDPNPVDNDREDAEVVGFEKVIDPFCSDPNTFLGSKILSVSPKGEEGSRYNHNFYDIFVLKEKNRKRYVEMSRYSSGLEIEDYRNFFNVYRDFRTAADFLANPIFVGDMSVTAEEIHHRLHQEHEYMTPEEFKEIWTVVENSTFIEDYIFRRDAGSFNAILNFADDVWENRKKKEMGLEYRTFKNYRPSYIERGYYEKRKVRQVVGGCPGKSGADTDDSPFSVSEFGSLEPDKYGERTFKCPACGEINIRPKDELLEQCQHCGSKEVSCSN